MPNLGAVPIVDFSDVTIMFRDDVKLSNKDRYALGALFDLSFYAQGRAAQVKDIAERQGIPPRFLEQIFQELKRVGLVTSKRGPQGGYALARPPNEIRLGDLVRALDGPIALSDGKNDPSESRKPGYDTKRVTESVLGDLSRRIEACFDAITVADLCERAVELGVLRPQSTRIVYSI
jgi:Rrf2 family protein